MMAKQETGKDQENGREEVKNRLLDAAEKLFCEKGFDGTSIRELTASADCNLAAVNYHFGNKRNLYIEMFHRQFSMMIQQHLNSIDRVMGEEKLTLEKLLRAIMEPPIQRIFNNEPRGQIMRLLVREVLNRQLDPEIILKDLKTKLFDRLGAVFKQLVPGLPDDKLMLLVCSFDGVVFHPFLFMEMYMKIIPDLTIEQLLEHMVKFVAAAICGYTNISVEGEC